jgi:hypothetical protein
MVHYLHQRAGEADHEIDPLRTTRRKKDQKTKGKKPKVAVAGSKSVQDQTAKYVQEC